MNSYFDSVATTKPIAHVHTITPKNKKVLHWHKTPGRNQHGHPHSKAMGKDAVFAKKVNHPGTRPNPFIRKTFHQKMAKIIHKRLNEEITSK